MTIFLSDKLVRYVPKEPVPTHFDIAYLTQRGKRPISIAEIRSIFGFLTGTVIRYLKQATMHDGFLELKRFIEVLTDVVEVCEHVLRSRFHSLEDKDTALKIIESVEECANLLGKYVDQYI